MKTKNKKYSVQLDRTKSYWRDILYHQVKDLALNSTQAYIEIEHPEKVTKYWDYPTAQEEVGKTLEDLGYDDIILSRIEWALETFLNEVYPCLGFYQNEPSTPPQLTEKYIPLRLKEVEKQFKKARGKAKSGK